MWRARVMLAIVAVVLVTVIGGAVESGASMRRGTVRDLAAILRIEDRREPVRSLAPYLNAFSGGMRARAALAVGRIAGPSTDLNDPEARAALALLAPRLAEDRDPEVRHAAAFALGLVQTEGAAAAVAALLAAGREPDPEVRAAAVEALGRCGPDLHPAAMAAALGDADARVVQAALLAVWKGSSAAHIPRILELSHSADPETRWRAAYAIMRSLGARAAGRTPVPAGAALNPADRTALAGRLLDLAADADVRARLQALRGLGSVLDPGEPSSDSASGEEFGAARTSIADVLLRALGDEDPRVRIEAVRSMGALYEGAGAQAPGSPASCDPHPHVRVEILRALGRIHEPAALMDLLAAGLTSEAEWEREVAIEAAVASCRRTGLVQQALHVAQRALSDPSWRVRCAGAVELAAIWEDLRGAATEAGEGRRVLRDLLRRCLADEPRVAKAALGAWLSLRSADGAGLGELLAETDAWATGADEILRSIVADGLREHIQGRAGAPLAPGDLALLQQRIVALAADPSSEVRTPAVGLTGALLATEAREWAAELLLRTARGDTDRLIRAAAIGALRAAAAEGDAWRAEVAALTPGPQETGWTVRDYERAFREARSCRAAVVRTAGGTLRFELLGDEAPLTVYNFVRLAESGYFDGGAWHRVVPDFVVQDGCPRGDGWGGPGRTIRCEYNQLPYAPGMVGMALSGKDTGGSQFFFTLADQPHLDGCYTVFGRLTEGWDVLSAISQGEPIASIAIERDRQGR